MNIWKEFSFSIFPNIRTLHVALFQDVKNSDYLKQQLQKSALEVALINPELILDEFQIGVAATRSLFAQENGSMITKNIHSELVFTLSGSKNIGASLKNFGISSSSNTIIAGIFDATKEKINEVTQIINGNSVEWTPQNLKASFFPDKAIKIYNFSSSELESNSLLKAIVNCIATKDI